MEDKQILCPVCKSICPAPINSYSVEASAAHMCPPWRNADRNARLKDALFELWPTGNCKIYRCGTCQFGFGVPFVGGNEKYYQILHEQMGYPSWRWDYDLAIEKLENKEGGKILDIGAGVGKFLLGLDQKWEKYAIESSDTTISKLSKKGITVYKSLDDLPDGYRFSCVTLFQVLEHISQFEDLLKKVSSIVQKNGALIITVPDADAMFQQEEIIGYADMPPNHINKWTVQSLKMVLEEVGFTVDEVVMEKRLLKNLKAKLHMKILALSMKKGTICSKIYRVSNKKIRTILIALIAPFVMLPLIPKLNFLLQGGAFGVIATKK